jgi:hypothetical protein
MVQAGAHHRLNNTAFLNEEDKIDPSPTPMEEFKTAQVMHRVRISANPLPTEED